MASKELDGDRALPSVPGMEPESSSKTEDLTVPLPQSEQEV